MRAVLFGIGGLAALALLIQVVPYGRSHTNPPVRMEPTWDSQTTRELVVRACFDCHSNETVWPWYSNIAPISWMIQQDVDRGRGEVNYSQWDRPQREGEGDLESVAEGEMPPAYYSLMHPEAKLSPDEIQNLLVGLEATMGANRR